jgi:acyl dehydratase
MSQEQVLAQLQESIDSGEERVSDWVLVDQKRIDLFAEATGDFQWIHVDAERARAESPYKNTIAHGYLTLSLLPTLTKAVTDGGSQHEGVKLSVNYGSNKVRFPAPVVVDSRVRSRSRLKDVSEVAGGLQLVREVTVEVEGQEKPAMVAETVSRMYF